MTFFEQQHLARRNTALMVLLFVLAVIAVIAAVDLVLAGAYLWSVADYSTPAGAQPSLATLWRLVPRRVYVGGAIATAALIGIVSLFNVGKLASGGAAVAQMTGARRIASDTRDSLERQLLDVIEEMAIAAGLRVPAVYVMDAERGINAFAAGWNVSDAVVVVTRGALETLTRDELQGVIGHEFSHILNGDMRLNIRMIGVLAGIVFIGAVGDFVMRNVRGSRDRATGVLFFAGLALFIIGYVGLFFARLIKSAVSRQREFLADASSVQFTRNPDGIAGALDQIRASSAGATISGRYAEDLSHMFFGQGVRTSLGSLFDTHPPLEERIRRVNPRFQPSAYRNRRSAAAAVLKTPAASTADAGAAGVVAALVSAQSPGRRIGDVGAAWGRSAGDSMRLVGTLEAGKIDHAARLLASLPAALRESLRDADGAAAAMIALLLASKDEVMRQQLDALAAAGLDKLAERAQAAVSLASALAPQLHLPVIDLALPALKTAPDQTKRDLIRGLEAVIHADRRVSLHEFIVLTLVRDQLAQKGRPEVTGKKVLDLQAEAAVVLALVAHAGMRTDANGARMQELQTAIRAGAKEMGIAEPVPAAASHLTLDAATGALAALKLLAPLQKALLVKGLFAAVLADGTIRIAEVELMRLVGAVLDCPLPPLLEDLDPATLAA